MKLTFIKTCKEGLISSLQLFISFPTKWQIVLLNSLVQPANSVVLRVRTAPSAIGVLMDAIAPPDGPASSATNPAPSALMAKTATASVIVTMVLHVIR